MYEIHMKVFDVNVIISDVSIATVSGVFVCSLEYSRDGSKRHQKYNIPE